MKIDVGIKKVNMIMLGGNSSIVIAEIESWEQKREIMNKKKGLRKEIIIEDDLTKKEKEIQKKLREVAKRMRKKGKKDVKVGYKKIRIEEKNEME